MNRKEIEKKLEKVFRDVFDDEKINIFNEMTANDIEEWDSLMHIHLIIAIEKGFDIHFDTTEVVNTANVGEFIDLLIDKHEK